MSSLCLTLIKSSWLNSGLELALLTLELVLTSILTTLLKPSLSYTLISFNSWQWPLQLPVVISIHKWTLASRGTTSGETLEEDTLWLSQDSCIKSRPVNLGRYISRTLLFALYY